MAEDHQRNYIIEKKVKLKEGNISERSTDKQSKDLAYLQYRMLSAPAITRGARDFVPALSSTLSMMKMATIDVKAIVI